jgi:hypothetical protein
MQAMADLATIFIPEDRRFCSKATFVFLRNSEPGASDVTRRREGCINQVPPSWFYTIPREGSIVRRNVLGDRCKLFGVRTGGADVWSTAATLTGKH